MAGILDTLATVNSSVQLGLEVGEAVYPLVSGIIKSIEQKVQADNIEYTVVISTGVQAAQTAAANFKEGLDEVNAELVRLGQDPLPVPEE